MFVFYHETYLHVKSRVMRFSNLWIDICIYPRKKCQCSKPLPEPLVENGGKNPTNFSLPATLPAAKSLAPSLLGRPQVGWMKVAPWTLELQLPGCIRWLQKIDPSTVVYCPLLNQERGGVGEEGWWGRVFPQNLWVKLVSFPGPWNSQLQKPHDFFKNLSLENTSSNGAKLSESCVFWTASSVFMRILLGGFLPMSSSKWLPSWWWRLVKTLQISFRDIL